MVEKFRENIVYGSTGEIGKDGFLTFEQQILLNGIQEGAATTGMDYLSRIESNDLYPMVAMATGIGKGRIVHLALERQMRAKPDSKVLIIAGTKVVLVDQTHEALSGYQQGGGNDRQSTFVEAEEDEVLVEETEDTEEEEKELGDEKSFLYTLGKYGKADTNVQIATIQTVQSKVNAGVLNPDDYDLVIVDEVHNIGTKLRLDAVQKFKKVIGFTATPHRNSGKMKTPEQYGFVVVESLTLPEAQDARLLPPLLGIQIDTKDLVDEIPTTASGAIDFKALEKLLKESPDLRPFIADRVASIITDPSGRKYKTVIACNYVWEAQELAQFLHDKGIKVGVAINKPAAKEIHTEEIPAVDSIERYKLPENNERSIQVLISPYVASEGFDAPFTEVLVWASPTDSDLRYTQYTGRLARRAEGKLFGVLVDCLYQTSQYSWSYNIGMWMKGNVVQLDNGLLYLGPESDIVTLRNLPIVENLRRQSDIKPIKDLLGEGLEETKETDLIFSFEGLGLFRGDLTRIFQLARQIKTKLESDHPEYFARRKNSKSHRTPVVDVVTEEGRQYFIEAMLSEGVSLKKLEMQEIQETDLSLAYDSIHLVFVVSKPRYIQIRYRVLEKFNEENSHYITQRRSGSEIVDVVIAEGRESFIEKILEEGVVLQDSVKGDVEDDDLLLSASSLKSLFPGGWKKISSASSFVQDKLQINHPEYFTRRRNGKIAVDVVTSEGRSAYIQAMLEAGMKLKDK